MASSYHFYIDTEVVIRVCLTKWLLCDISQNFQENKYGRILIQKKAGGSAKGNFFSELRLFFT